MSFAHDFNQSWSANSIFAIESLHATKDYSLWYGGCYCFYIISKLLCNRNIVKCYFALWLHFALPSVFKNLLSLRFTTRQIATLFLGKLVEGKTILFIILILLNTCILQQELTYINVHFVMKMLYFLRKKIQLLFWKIETKSNYLGQILPFARFAILF